MAELASRISVPHARLGKVFAVTVLLLSCAAAYWLGSRETGQPNEGLMVATKSLDFGDVWETTHFEFELPIQNTTHEDVEIQRFSASCECLSVHPESLVIPKEEQGSVHLILDLTTNDPKEVIKAKRDFAVRIIPSISGKLLLQEGWNLLGRVRKAYDISPRALDLGESMVRGRRVPTQTLQVSGCVPLGDLVATCDPKFASVSSTRQPGKSDNFEVQIALKDSVPAGYFSFRVELQGVLRTGEQLPSISIPVRGTVLEVIRINPPAALLGARLIGEAPTETVVLQSIAGSRFQVTNVNVSSEDVIVERLPGALDDRLSFRVTQRILRTSLRSERVTFEIQAPGGAMIKVPFPISYFGVALSVVASSDGAIAPPAKVSESTKDQIGRRNLR